MDQGRVDLEKPACHAISGPDEEAAPLLGNAPPSPAGRRRCNRRELCCWLNVVLVLVPAALTGPYFYMVYGNIPSFTVRLAGLDGIDQARPARVISPTFSLTLRMNKTCADRADVAVSYSGVALGWARVAPRDCAAKRPGMDVAMVARGDGVGLSRGLRELMAEERRRSGAVELDVKVIVYNDGPHWRSFGADVSDNKVMVCKLMTDGLHASESDACTWYSLEPLG